MTRAYESGAILPTGTTLFKVSLSNPVWVRAYVTEERLGDIHPGMKVTVLSDSDRSCDGQIGYISPQAESTPKNVGNTGVANFACLSLAGDRFESAKRASGNRTVPGIPRRNSLSMLWPSSA